MLNNLPDHDLLRRWLDGEVGIDAIEGHEDLKRVVNTASRLTPPPSKSKADAWEALSTRLRDTSAEVPETPVSRPLYARFGVWALSAAAVLVVLVGLFYLLQNKVETETTLRGEQMTLTLPDGSTVTLNADSKIRYHHDNWSQERIAELEGEAFFEVTKGKPFIVKTANGDVAVLGTSFNVYAREKNLEVSCHTGKVAVTHTDSREFILDPGLAVHFFGEKIAPPHTFNPNATAQWQKGSFSFDNKPLNQVIAVLERQFDVTIEGTYPQGRMYTGGFTNQDLDSALSMVFNSYEDISFARKSGNRIVLSESAR